MTTKCEQKPSRRYLLTRRELPPQRDMRGNLVSVEQLYELHMETVRSFANGVVDAYSGQLARGDAFGISKDTAEFAASVAEWTDFYLRKLALEKQGRSDEAQTMGAPQRPLPQQLEIPERWPRIVYDWQDALAEFVSGRSLPPSEEPRRLNAPAFDALAVEKIIDVTVKARRL